VSDAVAATLLNISKSFNGVQVLRAVSLELKAGEVHAIVGENGAGKSTLVKVLMGSIAKDSGEIVIGGVYQGAYDMRAARHAGITMIPQELALVPAFTVAENIMMGHLPRIGRSRLIDWNGTTRRAQDVLGELGFAIDPRARVDRLPIAYRQMVAVAKAVADKARVIIMDEPTSSLGREEVARLLDVVTSLKKRGATIVYISHLLDEVFQVADRITVLRDGRHVETKSTGETTQREIVSLMVGEDLLNTQNMLRKEVERTRIARGAPLLEVRGLRRKRQEAGASFAVHRGEVVGITGLVGSGKTELARTLLGLERYEAGEILIDGKVQQIRRPRHAQRHGIFMVPEDRKLQGLVLLMSVKENISLSQGYRARISTLGVINREREAEDARTYVERLKIKVAGLDQRVYRLSGGNQQKVVISKALLAQPKILMLDEPTRGIDVGAKATIYQLIRELADSGVTVLLFSSEISEVLLVSDRVLVMRAGKIVAEMPGGEATQDRVLQCAAGVMNNGQ
jgi:ABC-type sugar transport system ATPase subunit